MDAFVAPCLVQIFRVLPMQTCIIQIRNKLFKCSLKCLLFSHGPTYNIYEAEGKLFRTPNFSDHPFFWRKLTKWCIKIFVDPNFFAALKILLIKRFVWAGQYFSNIILFLTPQKIFPKVFFAPWYLACYNQTPGV